ncbi:MAG: thymidine phosphorylase [Methanoregulaceae archaeon]|nr:thymidine phosphorylase [Methanoregulaceae archaeon]
MTFRELIAAKRDRRKHTREELDFLARCAAAPKAHGVEDYQLSAWLMAAYLNGLDLDETADLTLAMAQSGDRLNLDGLPHPWVDKHSTGGVGDKTTLVLLPLLAACGLTGVKMSGKGLGITGGTIDKLGSIPGFRTDLTPEEMIAQAGRIGLALTGQTPRLAPADGTLYALRDTTETVASMPLIVASILSKKLAGGAEVLGLDVKCGSGAFMKTLEQATQLAEMLVEVARRCGLPTHATITDMDQPLSRAVGNALEVREAWETLQPDAPSTRFRELCIYLAAETLVAVGWSKSQADGQATAEARLQDGSALDRASLWIAAQGGTFDGDALPAAPVIRELKAPSGGWVSRVDARVVGQTVVELGGGRQRKEDIIDPAVGIEVLVEVGDQVGAGQPVFRIHAKSDAQAETASLSLTTALEVTAEQTPRRPLVLGTH